MALQMFVSHRSEDRELALTFRRAVRELSSQKIEVAVCEEMPGGEEWRRWIDDAIKHSTMLVMLYTDERADWAWCLYEIGLFLGAHKLAANGGSHLVCIRASGISTLLSPIAHYQSYSSDEDDIEKFLTHLLYRGAFTNTERINDALFTEMHQQLTDRSAELARAFCSTVSESFTKVITIGLPTADAEQGGADLERAYVDGDPVAMSLLDAPATGIGWGPLYTQWKETNQTHWLDEIGRIVHANGRGDVGRSLARFVNRDQISVVPVVWRMEKKRFAARGRSNEKVTSVKVMLIQEGRALQDREFAHPRDMLKRWNTYIPASLIRIRWKKKTDQFGYTEADMLGAPIVSDVNPAFANLYDFAFQGLPNPDGEAPLTSERLLKRIDPYVEDEHRTRLRDDQSRVGARIIFEEADAYATVPLQFNGRHPYFPRQCFLPCLIAKRLVGEQTGPHETYLLVCYVQYFHPLVKELDNEEDRGERGAARDRVRQLR